MEKKKLRNYISEDTIAAIATFPAASALSVIRVSGKRAFEIMDNVFRAKSGKKLKRCETFTLHYGWIVSRTKKKEEIVDEVLVSVMKGPGTYTGEDLIEVSTHGGVVVTNKVLKLILRQGARLANKGEFTYRAFINGKVDLIKAESVVNIVHARSDKALMRAVEQLKGMTSERLKALRENIYHVFTLTEAEISFPDQGIKNFPKGIRSDIKMIQKEFDKLERESMAGKILKEGVKCVFCGKANVGKSTIFNRVLREERVIVSNVPGTTRDTVEETVNINGLALRLYDTAGLLEPKDIIAQKAVRRSVKLFHESDLILLVLDGSKKLNKTDRLLFDEIKDKRIVAVINKTDLKQKINLAEIKNITDNIVAMSALKDKNIKKIEQAIHKELLSANINRENALFLSAYQMEIIIKAKAKVGEIIQKIKQGYSLDFINALLAEILRDLEMLTGDFVSEDVLNDIFSKFCIGK